MSRLVDYSLDYKIDFSKILKVCPGIWMENKRKSDNNNGLWRIHNGLYDVTNFISVHPGGKFWLEETKGMDITEAFESHHVISDVPEQMLKRFYVRDAKYPRLSRLTFDEDDFYRTVKRRVRDVLKTMPSRHSKTTELYTDGLLLLTFITAICANYFAMYTLAIIAGLFGFGKIIASHNYIHMRDNFRMFYGDILLFPSRIIRILHVLSHHIYPNTSFDLQFIIGQPFINILPESKSFFVRYLSWIYVPLVFWPLLIYILQLLTVLEYFATKVNRLSKASLLSLAMPIAMYSMGGQSLMTTFWMWQVYILSASFMSSMVAFTLNHIPPTVYVEADMVRTNEELDWGIFQLDTVKDRLEVSGNKLLVLTTFGDHALHQLFPTIDHGNLQYLRVYPVVEETLKKFTIAKIRLTTHTDLFTGYFKRLAEETPNSDPFSLGYKQK